MKLPQPRALSFFRFIRGRALFAIAIPLVLLIGGNWLEKFRSVNLPEGLIDRVTALKTSTTSWLGNALDQPMLLPTSSDNSLAILPMNGKPIQRFGLTELSLHTDYPAANPYDPKEIELKVQFNSPSGRKLDVGAFWYQDYDPATRQPKGKPAWKVRFSPDEVGEWSASAYISSRGVRSLPVTFKVTQSDRPGFIHTNPANPYYLAYENGDFFFPIGVNMAWWGGCCDPLQQYRKWLDQFSANGGNTIRVWMAAWSFGIEWKDTGLGNYDNRQYEAWLLDQLFKMAAERHVKLILVLVNHGPFSLVANSEWDDNPYNRQLGGPISSPAEFVTDPAARAYYQQRLSYIINRWGYSPDLLAWEWWNEVDLTPITEKALIPWLKEMSTFLEQRDVNHHLTTNSFSASSWSGVWRLPQLDIIQVHDYSEHHPVGDRDPAMRAGQELQTFKQALPAKPILLGEFGYSARENGDNVEKTGIQLHNGLWATTFSGYAGSGMYWWWDIYIAANNLWPQYKGLSAFMDGVDLTYYQPLPSLKITGGKVEIGRAVGLGLQGKDTLIWLRSADYTVDASIEAKGKSQGSQAYNPPQIEGQMLTLEDIGDGFYTVFWFDPQTAEWLAKAEISSIDNTLTVPIPAFRRDLAAKIVRNP